MPSDPTRIPVLVGLGQSIERDAVVDVVDLATRAADAAFGAAEWDFVLALEEQAEPHSQ